MTITTSSYDERGRTWVKEQDLARDATSPYFETTYGLAVTAVRVNIRKDTTNTPDYIAKEATNRLPMNFYEFRRETVRYGSGYYIERSGEILQSGPNKGLPRYYKVYSGIPGSDAGPPSVKGLSNAEFQALDRACQHDLLMKIKDQKVNLLQAYAERSQTAKTVGDSAIRLATALRAVKRGDVVKAAAALGLVGKQIRRQDNRNYYNQQKRTASDWLALQYGWRPLINDVYGACEALANTLHRNPIDRVVKVRRASRDVSSPVYKNQTLYEYWDREQSTTCIRYSCNFTAGAPFTKTLSELGITNPALIVWELMPWSFVIDWFIPIGAWISSWDATLGLQFQSGSKTVFLKGETQRVTNYLGTGYGGTRSGMTVANTELVSHVRTPLSGFPSPQLPALKNPLSLEHLANAMALLRSVKN
jgi:hypothetical protein